MPGQKNVLKYVSLSNPKSFYKSKVYTLLKAVERFNLKFEGKIHINLDRWTQVKHELTTKKSISALDSSIKERAGRSNFLVFDLVDDEESKKCVESVVSTYEGEFNIRPEIADGPKEGYLNIGVNHDKEYYARNKGAVDPYKIYNGLVVNHVTVESFMRNKNKERTEKSKRMLLKVDTKELFIKEDLLNGHITLDDWSARDYSGDITFAKLHTIKNQESEDNERFVYKMTVHCDGSFEIEKTSEDDEYLDDISKSVLEAAELYDKGTFEGAIMDCHGNINIIHRTDIITVPEDPIIGIFDKNAKDGEKSMGSRTHETKNTILHGNLDIRVLMTKDEMYYFVGDLSEMAHLDTNAPNVRRVVPTCGSSVFFDTLLDLMKVPFVKYNMSTILPYPFKYLNEYVASTTETIPTQKVKGRGSED
jgi:hypothetical protein